MKDTSDILTVSFDSELGGSAMCVSRKYGEKAVILKMELNEEQVDIIHRLLTEQMTKAEIKKESEG